METTTRLKRLAATCLVAGTVYGGMAGACESTPEQGRPIRNDTRPIAPAAEQDEHMNLPSRFSAADVHPSEDQVDTSETAQTLPVGPQYTISEHVTLGGSLTEPDVSDFATAPQPGSYAFGLRITF